MIVGMRTAARTTFVAITVLFVPAWACACGDGSVEPPPPDPPRPTTVTVSPATARLVSLGATVQLSADVRDQNGDAMTGATVTWSSSDAAVATVDGSGLVTAVDDGTTTITATAGSVAGTAAVTVAQVPAEVVVEPAAHTLVAFGDTIRLSAEARDANGNAVATAEFAWSSSDTLVATVDASGLVTAAGNGAAMVTATAGSASGTAAVTVEQVPSEVVVEPAAHTLVALGDTIRLSAEALDANATVVATAEFTWSSSDTLVVTVDDSGLIAAVDNGAAMVTATAGSASGTAAVTVEQVVAEVVVEPAAPMIVALGDTIRLSAEALDANANVVATAEFMWSSDGPGVATVDASGLVTAVANGSATITATAGSALGTASVTVEQVPSEVVVEPAAHTLVALGDTIRLSAEAYDANGNVADAAEFAWSSSDTAITTVDAGGLVTAVANGTARVTATSAAAAGTAAVTVAQEVGAVTVSPAADTVLVANTVRLWASATDANGYAVSGAKFVWASGDTLVAVVDGEGLVTGISAGDTEITAASGSVSGTAMVHVGRVVSVSLSSVPTNGGLTEGAGEWLWFPDGPVTTSLVAKANPGYDFDRWIGGGNTLSTNSRHRMEVSGDHAVTARFSVNQQKGKWTPGGTYTWYDFEAGDYGVDSISWTFLPVTDPPQSLADQGLLHYYAMNFGVTNSISGFGRGYAGLQTNGLMHGKQWRKSINFSIWGSNASRTNGQTEKDNFECKCHRILYEFSWEEGRAYRFVLKAGPSGTDREGKWWGLWVTDVATGTVTFLGEQRVPTRIQGLPATTLSPRGIHVFGEDLYWWLAAPGHVKYVCSDFDPSSVAIIDVRAGARKPVGITNITNGGNTFTNPNGYVAIGCHVTITEGGQGNVQHNLGFWPEPPRNVVGGTARESRN